MENKSDASTDDPVTKKPAVMPHIPSLMESGILTPLKIEESPPQEREISPTAGGGLKMVRRSLQIGQPKISTATIEANDDY